MTLLLQFANDFFFPFRQHFRLDVIDAAGRRVAELGAGVGSGSAVALRWTTASPGVYWARLTRGNAVETRRIVRLDPGGR